MRDPTSVSAYDENTEILVDTRMGEHEKLVERFHAYIDAAIKTLREIEGNGCDGSMMLTVDEMIEELQSQRDSTWNEDSIREAVEAERER